MVSGLSWLKQVNQLTFSKVSILLLGCWLGSIVIGYFADKIGRKYSIVLSTVVFLLGSALQGAAMNIGWLLGSRFVTGLGVGALSLLV